MKSEEPKRSDQAQGIPDPNILIEQMLKPKQKGSDKVGKRELASLLEDQEKLKKFESGSKAKTKEERKRKERGKRITSKSEGGSEKNDPDYEYHEESAEDQMNIDEMSQSFQSSMKLTNEEIKDEGGTTLGKRKKITPQFQLSDQANEEISSIFASNRDITSFDSLFELMKSKVSEIQNISSSQIKNVRRILKQRWKRATTSNNNYVDFNSYIKRQESGHQSFGFVLADNLSIDLRFQLESYLEKAPTELQQRIKDELFNQCKQRYNHLSASDDFIIDLRSIMSDCEKEYSLKFLVSGLIKVEYERGLDDSIITRVWTNLIRPFILNDVALGHLISLKEEEIRILSSLMKSANRKTHGLSLNEVKGIFIILAYLNMDLNTLVEYYNPQGVNQFQFWGECIIEGYGIDHSKVSLLIKRSGIKYITQSYLRHIQKYGVTEKQIDAWNRFQLLREEELEFLETQVIGTNQGDYLIHYLSGNMNSFPKFSEAFKAAHYIKPDKLKTSGGLLKNKDLSNWTKIIQNLDVKDISDTRLKQAIDDVLTPKLTEHQMTWKKLYEQQGQAWDYAFKQLQDHTLCHERKYQKDLSNILYFLSLTIRKPMVLAQVCTGHGKSLIIAALSMMILKSTSRKVVVVTPNKFLAQQGHMIWGCEQSGIGESNSRSWKYLSIEEFENYVPSANSLLIIDEVDYFFKDNPVRMEGETFKLRGQDLQKYNRVIGLSGTLNREVVQSIEAIIQPTQPLEVITLPDLREGGEPYEITKLVDCNPDNLFSTIDRTIKQLQQEGNNCFVIFENETKLKEWEVASEVKATVISQFSSDHNQIIQTVKRTTRNLNFVIATTEEGGRGLDYQNKSQVQVIITFEPQGKSELVQMLGRSSRSTAMTCKGVLIYEGVNILEPEDVMGYFESKEVQVGEKKNFMIMAISDGIKKKVFEKMHKDDRREVLKSFRRGDAKTLTSILEEMIKGE